MITILKFIFTAKRIIGLAFASFCAFWLFSGPEILSPKPGRAESEVITNFKRSHPKTANWITEQQDRFGQYNTAVAIQSVRGLSLNPEALKQSIQIRARLTSLYQQDQTHDESILWSHGTALDAMGDLPAETDTYLKSLESAKLDRDYWSLVRNDPVALSSELLKSDLELRKDYQANQTWYFEMLEVLVAMVGIMPEADASEESADFIKLDDLLQVVTDGKPHLMQLVPKPSETPIEACIYFETFRQFGQAIAMAAKEGVPAKEAAEVIVLNRDALVSDEAEHAGARVNDPASIAARLVQLYQTRPSVWSAAQRDGYVLSFDKLTPGLSQSVLEKYPDLGAASLIVTQYADVATQAAAIIDNYGDLGVAVLVQYAGSDNFHKLLQNANVDHRVAMIAVLKSDAGLEAVLKDPAYVAKWIGEDGKPLQDEWWVAVPFVGSMAKVAKNYAVGVPSEWDEIGWAAWDVADTGLTIISLGSSKLVTEASKQAGKQTAKRVGKAAATKMTKSGIKRIAGVAKSTAIARLVAVAKASKVAAPIRWTIHTLISVGGPLKTAGGKLIVAGHRIIQTAGRIPPGVRKWAARGLLGASLFIRGPERIRALLASINNYGRKPVEDWIKPIPKAIGDAMEQLRQLGAEFANSILATLLNFVILGGSGCLALFFLLGMRRPHFARTPSGNSNASLNKTTLRKRS